MKQTAFTQLGRNTFIYTIGGLIQRAVSFLLLPVYTRYLSKADYGVMQLLDITVDIAAILFVSGMTAGLQRFYFASRDDKERHLVVSTAFLLELGLGAVAAFALYLAAPLARHIGLGEPQHVELVRIAAANFLLGILSSVPLLLMQTQRQAGYYLLATMGKLALQVSLNLTFLVGLGLGVRGILYAGLLVNAILGIVLAIWLSRTVGLRLSPPVLRQLRRFGVPYQISTAGSFILVFGDRFFLGHHRTIGEVGLYGLAYQFGFLLGSIVEVPFFRAWNPVRFQQAELPRAERDGEYSRGLDLLAVLLTLFSTAIVLFTPPVIRLATSVEFHPAAQIVPLIVVAYVVQCYTMVVAFGIDVSTRTTLYTYATWSSVAVILVLYALLIPPYGAFGAAWATLLAFGLRFGLTYWFAQRAWPVSYTWGPTIRATLVGALALLINRLTGARSILHELSSSVALTLATAIALWLFVLHASEREAVLTLLRKVRGRLGRPRASAV